MRRRDVARPPAAATTAAERRGPPWLLTIFDFLERQLSLAATVPDRVTLVRAYTLAALALSVTALIGIGAMAWALAQAEPSSLVVLAIGAITGLGARYRRRANRQSTVSIPTFGSPSDTGSTTDDQAGR